jgi:two-component system cell cycle sensor histidine kinase/response regulator CckA
MKGKTTVLLIEDDLETLSTLSEILISAGYDVKSANDAQSALQFLTTDVYPRWVVLDYEIAGLDAEQYLSRLKMKFPHTKIILSSGYPEDFIKRESSMGSVDKFIAKPFNPSFLINEMKDCA